MIFRQRIPAQSGGSSKDAKAVMPLSLKDMCFDRTPGDFNR
jgi:hypothetical protein